MTKDTGGQLEPALWLRSADGGACIRDAALAVAEHPRDPLAAATSLRSRHPEATAQNAAAALEQAHLNRLAADRYGINAGTLLVTRDGLEQATRPVVAARRAGLLRAAGARRVLDLTAGLGFDARAFLAEGLEVIAVERDPAVAAFLDHNAPGAEVVVADATADGVLVALVDRLDPVDVVFVDPARRDPRGPRHTATGRARPERDPSRWSPPWEFVESIPHPRVAAKAAPSFRPPRGWQAEWTSVQRTVVECAVYSWPLLASSRRAAIVRGDHVLVIGAIDAPVPIAPAIGAWVHEPDPALLRADALAAVLEQCPGTGLVDAASTWLTGDSPAPATTGLRSYRVIAEISGSRKAQRRLLDTHGVSGLSIKSRDTSDDPRTVLRELGMPEGGGHVLVLTRRSGRVITLLVEPARVPPA